MVLVTKNKTFALILFICTYFLIFYYVVVPQYKDYKRSKTYTPEVDRYAELKFNLDIPSNLKLTKMSSQVYMIEDVSTGTVDSPFRAGIYIEKMLSSGINLTEKALNYCDTINIPVESVKDNCKHSVNTSIKPVKINNIKGVEFEYLHFEYYKHIVLLLVGDTLFEFTLYGEVGNTLAPSQIDIFDKIVSSFYLR